MIRSSAVISVLLPAILGSAVAAQPRAEPAAEVTDRDTLCFVAAAVTSRRLEATGGPTSQRERDRLRLLTGVATFHGGRLSLRYSREQLPSVFAAAVAAAERLPDVARTAEDCVPQFLDFMRIVSGDD